ncbi:hypothetical protein Q7P35_005572 [Cladosporium inversicolor]
MASLDTGKAEGSVPEDRAVDHVDLILCPPGPGCALPLNTSYASQWNLLDYPAILLPTGMTGEASDVQNAYILRNESDEYNQSLYDPEKFVGVPISLQMIGRQITFGRAEEHVENV